MADLDEGGGASRSTDSAAGSSTATDVSLKEYGSREDYWLDRLTNREAFWLDRHFTAEIEALRRETSAAFANAQHAITVAETEAKARLEAHNGLIEQNRELSRHFASAKTLEDFKTERHEALDSFKAETDKRFTTSKETNDTRFGRIEEFQNRLTGAILLLAAIGVANLVKVWTG